MTKEKKAEVVKTLTECKHSGFTADDQAMLEAASDVRLEAFLVAAEAREKEVKALEEARREPKALTEDEFMRVAPAEIKSLVERTRRADTELKAELVTALKAAQGEYTESELAAMPVNDLQRLARMAKLEEATPSFEGRGIPRMAGGKETDVFANPPDPYAPGLEKMRAASA